MAAKHITAHKYCHEQVSEQPAQSSASDDESRSTLLPITVESSTTSSPNAKCEPSTELTRWHGISFNCRKITRIKLDYLRELAKNDNSLLGFLLNETGYQEQSNTEVNINGFKVYRADRLKREGGGAAIYVNNFFVNQLKVLSYSNDTCEAAGVIVEKENLALLALYRPPNTISYKLYQMLKAVKDWLATACNDQTEIVIYGDFNFRNLKWKMGDTNLISNLVPGSLKNVQFQIEETLEFMSSFYLEQKVSSPSRGINFLDLMFTNSYSLKEIAVVDVDTSISDHRLIEWAVNVGHSLNKPCQNLAPIIEGSFDAFDFRRNNINWEKVRSELTASLVVFNPELSLDRNLDMFYVSCKNAMMKAGCPLKVRKKNFKRIPSDRKTYMRRISKIKKRLLGCISPQKKNKYTSELIELERCILKSLRNERVTTEELAVSKISSDPKYFYGYAKKYNTADTSIGPLKDKNGELTQDESKMANLLNEQFNSVFNTSHPNTEKKVCLDDDLLLISDPNRYCSLSTLFHESNGTVINQISVTKEKVEKAIDKMKRSSSPGPDLIPALFFKETKCCVSVFLAAFLNASFCLSYIPQILKDAIVTPIPKGGDSSKPINYRPISLTCHIIKIMERIVAESIVEFLNKNDILSSKQHGFRSNHSTISELLVHYHNIVDALDNDANYDAVMLDYSKAFDTVSHSLLLYKIKEIGITDWSIRKMDWLFFIRQKAKGQSERTFL